MADNHVPALRLLVVQLVTGIGHSRSNIAAVHFDGPWLDECLRVANEIERIGVDIRHIHPKVY